MADKNTPSPIAEISHGPSKFDAFLDKHQKKMIALAVVATVGIVTFIVVDGMNKMELQDAGSKVYNAKGENELLALTKEGSENSKATATFLLAEEQGKVDKAAAVATLNDLLSKFPNSPLVFDAELRIGNYLYELGKVDEAKAAFENLSNKPEAEECQVLAFAALANVAGEKGNSDEAKSLFKKASELSKSGTVKQNLNRYVSIAGVKSPTRVVPAPKKAETKKSVTDQLLDSSKESAVDGLPNPEEVGSNKEVTPDVVPPVDTEKKVDPTPTKNSVPSTEETSTEKPAATPVQP